MKITATLAFLVASAIAQASYANATVGNSSLQLQAHSQVLSPSLIVIDTDADSQSGTILPLSVSVDAFAQSGANVVRTYGQGEAVWINPYRGSVFFDTGFEANAMPDSRATIAPISDSTGWEYSFISDLDGHFTLDYSIEMTGTDIFGLNGYFVYFDDVLDWTLLNLDNSTMGSMSFPTIAGHSHKIQIIPTVVIAGSLGVRNAHMTGDFDWRFDAVPEPSTIAQFGVMLLLVSSRRRRRHE